VPLSAISPSLYALPVNPIRYTKIMSGKEVTKKDEPETPSATSTTYKKTTESVASVGAGLSGAFSGSMHAGGGASSKKTTTEKSTG